MKLRKRFLRQALDKYIEFKRWSIQHDKNMAGASYLRYKYLMLVKQKVFNSMSYYTQRNKKAHRYWNKILTKMDIYQK